MIPLNIPKGLMRDYTEPPDELLWRLQRIADFSPPMELTEKLSGFFSSTGMRT
jgi:hypothetical protein